MGAWLPDAARRTHLPAPTPLVQVDDRNTPGAGPADFREPASRSFARGFLTNILNPKVGVFYATFLPQFVPPGVHVTPFSMLLASIHAAEGVLWFSVLTLATRPLASWLRRPRVARALDRVTGVVFVGLGVELVLDKRD